MGQLLMASKGYTMPAAGLPHGSAPPPL